MTTAELALLLILTAGVFGISLHAPRTQAIDSLRGIGPALIPLG